MRFFVRMDETPGSPTFGEEQSLHRLEDTEEILIVERWDVEEGEWVDNPNLIRFIGIGGDEDYKEIEESEVDGIIEKLSERIEQDTEKEEEVSDPEAPINAEDGTEGPEDKTVKAGFAIVSLESDGGELAVERHGDHEQQEGRKGEKGGSQPGFTHTGAESGSESLGQSGESRKWSDGSGGTIPVTVYHGTLDQFGESIASEGLKMGKGFGRPPSVYFTTDLNTAEIVGLYSADEEREYAEKPKTGPIRHAVVEFEIPSDAGKNVIRDESAMKDAWRMEQDIPPEWIKAIHYYEAGRKVEIVPVDTVAEGAGLKVTERHGKHVDQEGRKGGEKGGSQPGFTHAEGSTKVGITSARKGVPAGKVFDDMREFAKELEAIEGLENVFVRPGLGGWDGGSEPTWIVEYHGNGKALELIRKTARNKNQDAVLVFEEAAEGEGSIISDFIIKERINPEERGRIRGALVDAGIGGWSWMRTNDGKRILRSAAIPQWGATDESHNESTQRLLDFFAQNDFDVEMINSFVKVTVLDREGDYAPR